MDKIELINRLKKSVYIPATVAIILLLALGQIVSPGFLSINNLGSVLMSASILTLASMAQASVIIAGNSGLDMSVGAIMSLTALFGPMINIINSPFNLFIVVIMVVLIGAVIGAISGIGVHYIKIVPLVMTLIMSSVVNGLALLITKGQPSVSVSNDLQAVGNSIIGPIRVLPIIVTVSLVLFELLLLRRSKFGKQLVLVGNNFGAAELCGINCKKTSILAYSLGGAIAGFAGLMLVGYAGSAQMQMANSYTMLSIAAVVIGGTKLTGGKGSYVGGALGAIVLVLITNFLQALNMAAGLRSLIQGLVLLFVLIINSRDRKLRQ